MLLAAVAGAQWLELPLLEPLRESVGSCTT
jgi:hypothetical protein